MLLPASHNVPRTSQTVRCSREPPPLTDSAGFRSWAAGADGCPGTALGMLGQGLHSSARVTEVSPPANVPHFVG